jgi:hypothetical protein
VELAAEPGRHNNRSTNRALGVYGAVQQAPHYGRRSQMAGTEPDELVSSLAHRSAIARRSFQINTTSFDHPQTTNVCLIVNDGT